MALIEGLAGSGSRPLSHTSGSSVIVDKARERLCIEPCVWFLPGSHDRM